MSDNSEPLVVPEGQLDYSFYPHQYRALELSVDHPITFLSGGVRNGKTRAAVAWCMARSGWGPFGKLPPKGKPRIGWIVVPTITPMWEHVRPEWESMWGFKESGGLIVAQRFAPTHSYEVLCPDGETMMWYVKSAEFPDRLRAASIWAAWMTEAAMNEEAVYSIVQQRVIASGGSIFMESSPFGMNWFWHRVIQRAHYLEDWMTTKHGKPPATVTDPMKDPRIAGIMGVPIEANLSITEIAGPEAIAQLRKDASREEEQREYDGKFFSWSGLIWRNFDPSKHVLKSHPTELDLDGAEIIAGMDFGWEHPFAHVWIAKKGNTYIVLDEYREKNLVLREHARRLLKNQYHSYVTWRYADPSAAQARAEMMDYRISSSTAENDVELGLNAVAQAIESGNFFVSPRCEKLIDEIGNYHRDEKTLKIVKVGDDLCDALRYAIYSDKVHGGGFTLPHYSMDEVDGRMKLQSDDPELIEHMREIGGDDTVPLSDGVNEDFDAQVIEDKEII